MDDLSALSVSLFFAASGAGASAARARASALRCLAASTLAFQRALRFAIRASFADIGAPSASAPSSSSSEPEPA